MGWDRAQSGPVIPGTPGSDKTLNGPIFVHSPCAPQAAQNRSCTKATERVTGCEPWPSLCRPRIVRSLSSWLLQIGLARHLR